MLQVFVYLAGAQLLASSPWRTAVTATCGLLVGAAYQYNFLGLKRLKVRKSADLMHAFCGRCPSANLHRYKTPNIKEISLPQAHCLWVLSIFIGSITEGEGVPCLGLHSVCHRYCSSHTSLTKA